MADTTRGFEFELCRKILFRSEELLAIPGANRQTRYVFEEPAPKNWSK